MCPTLNLLQRLSESGPHIRQLPTTQTIQDLPT